MGYSPIKLCDTKGMSEENWLKMRQHGPHWDDPSSPDYIPYCVGGSTVAGILGVSPWVTPLDVWEEKKGNKPDNPMIVNAEAKIAGHVWEDFVAQMVPHLDGYQGATIINDTGFYQHPYYPFAVANLDRRIINNGKEGILEIKTTNWRNFDKIKQWKEGIVPVYYEYQCRWYMAIMNLDYVDIVCAWGFTTNDMAIIHINRDLTIEHYLFNEVSQFIESLENNEPPSLEDVDPELAMESLKRLYGGDSTIEEMEFNSEKYFRVFQGLEEVMKEEEALKSEYKIKMGKLERRKAMFSTKICEALKRCEKGFVEKDGRRIVVTYKEQTQKRIDSGRMKNEIPSVYEKYLKPVSFRVLKLIEEDPE